MNTLIFRIILVFIMACLCNIGYSQDKKISELTATSLVYSNDDFVVNVWNGSAYANKRVNATNLINSLINFPLIITNNITATGDSNYLGTIFGDGTGLTGVQTAQTNISYVAVTNAPWGLPQTNISYVAVTNAPWVVTNANNAISGSNTITGPLHIAGPVTNVSTMVLTNAVATGTGYTGPTQILLNQNATGSGGYVIEYKTNNGSLFNLTTAGTLSSKYITSLNYVSVDGGSFFNHASRNRWYSPADGTMVWTPNAGIGTVLMAFTNGTFTVNSNIVANGTTNWINSLVTSNIYCWAEISGDPVTDRSDAPASVADALKVVSSIIPLENGKLDHSKLDPLAWGTKTVYIPTGTYRTNTVAAVMDADGKEAKPAKAVVEEIMVAETQPDQSKRNLSMVVSAQALVIQDLLKRIEALEKR